MSSTKQSQQMQVQSFMSSQLAQRLINQKKNYSKYHQEFISNFDYDDDTQYYLLSSNFLKDWKKYTAFSQQDLLIVPTDGLSPQSYNLDLVFVNTAGEKCFKQGLVQGQDYEIISKNMMKVFQNYKGETIQKKAFKLINGKKIVQVYDLKFTCFFISQKIVDKIDSHKQHIKIYDKCHISRYETIGKFKKALLRQYDKEYIGSSAKEVRIWKMNKNMNVQKYEQYIKLNSSRQRSNNYKLTTAHAIFYDRQDLIVEDISISNDDILIIEVQQIKSTWVIYEGSDEDNCQFCRKSKPLSFQCECKLVRYCSFECQSGDVYYHRRKCNYADQLQLKQIIQFEFTDNSKKGVCGLSNLGNTCFMNSCLQCLSNTTLLTKYFISKQYIGQINKMNPIGTKGKLTVKYAKMIQALWCKDSNSYSPSVLKNAISEFQPMFSGYSQHDSQQLLSFLLDGLHQDLNKVLQKPYVQCVDYNGQVDEIYAFESWKRYLMRNQSIICDIFMGQYKSKVVCPDCKFQSITFDPYSTISLPIPQVKKIQIQLFVFYQNFHQSTKKILIDVTVRSLKLWKQQVSKKLNIDVSNLFFYALSSQGECQKFDNDENLNRFIQASKKLQAIVIQESNYQQKLLNSILVYIKFIRLSVQMNQIVKYTVPLKRPFFLNFKNLNGQELYYQIYRYLYVPIFSNYLKMNKQQSEIKIRQLFNKQFSIFDKSPFKIYLMQESSEIKNQQANKKQQKQFRIEMDTQIHNLALDNNQQMKNIQIQVRLNKQLKDHIKNMYTYEQFNKFHKANTNKDQIIETYDLLDCLRQFQKTETLEVGNQWRCPKCKDFKLAYKSMSLYKTPKVLILHLKRFKQKSSYYKSKINSLVNFSLQLDLQSFVVNNTLTEAYFKNQNPNVDSSQSTKYQLYAVSNHYGGMGGGHYTAYAKNNNNWYDFNDSSVHQISPNTVISSAAYMLFYKRIN